MRPKIKIKLHIVLTVAPTIVEIDKVLVSFIAVKILPINKAIALNTTETNSGGTYFHASKKSLEYKKVAIGIFIIIMQEQKNTIPKFIEV
jgi:hypothetical protein